MNEKSASGQYELSIVPSDIKDLQDGLGKASARGAVLLQNVLTNDHARALRNDIAVVSGNTQTDARWNASFRLNEGDQRNVKHLRTIRGLADSLTKLFATDLAQMNTAFNRLEDWSPTEFTATHRKFIPAEPVVRKWHESNIPVRDFESNPPRFWGVIAIAIADGSADIHTNGNSGMAWEVQPGDLLVMRGARLFGEKDTGTPYPSFAIDNISKDTGLTAVVYRANASPTQLDANFIYENWPEK